MTTFQDTLSRHLQAIQDRDLSVLADTIAEDSLVLIMADGRLVRSSQEFLDLHRGWFALDDWRLTATPVQILETPAAGIAVLHLLYQSETSDAPGPRRQESYLTLAFERRSGRWVMVHDQNTPIQAAAGGSAAAG